jgi:hypothetical protein
VRAERVCNPCPILSNNMCSRVGDVSADAFATGAGGRGGTQPADAQAPAGRSKRSSDGLAPPRGGPRPGVQAADGREPRGGRRRRLAGLDGDAGKTRGRGRSCAAGAAYLTPFRRTLNVWRFFIAFPGGWAAATKAGDECRHAPRRTRGGDGSGSGTGTDSDAGSGGSASGEKKDSKTVTVLRQILAAQQGGDSATQASTDARAAQHTALLAALADAVTQIVSAAAQTPPPQSELSPMYCGTRPRTSKRSSRSRPRSRPSCSRLPQVRPPSSRTPATLRRAQPLSLQM